MVQTFTTSILPTTEACEETTLPCTLDDMFFDENASATLVASETRSRQTMIDKVVQDFPKVKIYPNPIHSYTNISINLPEEQEVQIDIYDLNGRRVSTIIPTTFLVAGTHLFEWSCDQVEAGIYFVAMNGRKVGRIAIVD